ncbi:MarR family winged helix-turn-helix transcriptional regulator [Polynucleobacter sp. IMCC 29146]|uniref:MarR family winged helix-turn-helix transcriptional regulator n=1 Tax=Polynucleobacter sp. IMCC 29146 TaxID=2780953 RepID=UPI001F479A3D|nr:MarR family transcriptional regulator [Polynucleobacter sp. IMCC 29146]MCE7530433.1 MarR family transcriptional regulator [Polynucleobacter sp. IMCC 29146]
MPLSNPNALHLLYDRPGFLLRRAHQISISIFEQECQGIKLTPVQYGILTVLHTLPGIDQSRLGRKLGLDKVTTLRVLRDLESRRLISRSAHLSDKRSYSLTLSSDGQILFKESQKHINAAYKKLASGLTETELITLVNLLRKFNSSLDAHARTSFQPAE